MCFLNTAYTATTAIITTSYSTITNNKLAIISSVIIDSVFVYPLALLFCLVNNIYTKKLNKNILNYSLRFGTVRKVKTNQSQKLSTHAMKA